MPETLRIAVIGTGKWGQNVLRTLNAMPGVEIAWTAGKDWKTKLQRVHGTTAPTDGVAIAVPAPAQPAIARAVLDASLPIFIEKPMALDAAVARLIRDKALVMGDLPVVVDHIGLFTPEYEVLRAELTGKTIESLETFAGNYGPFRDWGPHSTLWDYGPHEAAFALDLIGVPDFVSSIGTLSKNGDDYSASLKWQDGTWANLSFGNVFTKKTRQLIVCADQGTVWKLDGVAPVNRLTRNGLSVPVGLPVPPLERALGVWLAAVRGEPRDERVGCALGVKVTELLVRMIPPEGLPCR